MKRAKSNENYCVEFAIVSVKLLSRAVIVDHYTAYSVQITNLMIV